MSVSVHQTMKVTLPRAALSPALAALSRVVERRNTIPVLSNILLRAEAGRLTLRATDLDIEAQTSLPCEIETEGAVTVPAHTLTDIIRKLPAEAQVTLQQEGEAKMTVRSGRSRFSMNTLPESDFPNITTGEMSHRFALPAKTLAEMIASVEFAISTEETRYYLNGIHLHALDVAGEMKLRAVATDGHRLSRLELPAPEGAAGMPNVIVPRKTVGELARMAKEHDGEVVLELSTTKIRATLGETTLTSKLIDGTYPDYQRVIPAGNDKLATLDREEFQRAIDRVATISSERGRAVKLALSETGLALSVTNPDAGEAREETSPDYDGPSIEIGFNARYLLDVLGVLGGDSVQMKLADPGSPAIFQKRDGDPLLVVLMPMRV
jgi:DNA polymerase-3 subunit beta